MKASICWSEYSPIEATMEIAATGTIQVTYREADGLEYDIVLRTTDRVHYAGDFCAIDKGKKRRGNVTPSKFTKQGRVTAKRYNSSDETLLFGEMLEDGDRYFWWAQGEK